MLSLLGIISCYSDNPLPKYGCADGLGSSSSSTFVQALDYPYLINRYTDLGDVVVDLDCFSKPQCLVSAIGLGRVAFGFCSSSLILGAADEILKNVRCTVRKATLRSGKSLQSAPATSVPVSRHLKDLPEDADKNKFTSSGIYVLSITEAEFFQRVNSFKEHAPLHFDDMKTFSQIEKMYEDMLEEECHSQLLLVTTSEIPGSGNGLFTVAESTLRGRRFGYKGNFLRSSNAHELSAYFKKELLSMKCNTQELDSTDNAAVATYFENKLLLK